jgi:hypothetical protein
LFILASGQELELPAVITLHLGRGQIPDGTISLLDLTPHGAEEGGVSRFHARLHRRSNGFYLEDLSSTNGTYINEQRIPPYVLQGLRDGDKIQLGRLVLEFRMVGGESHTISNPYIAGAPIKGKTMFFGRDDIFEKVRARLVGQHQDNVVVIYGQRRTGKTSVLYQMGRRLNEEERRYAAVLVDLQGAALASMDNFLWELARTIQRALRRDYQVHSSVDDAAFQADARSAFRDSFLPALRQAIGERRLLLMFDEATRLEEMVAAGRLERDVFDYLRSLMQHERGLSFIFSLSSKLEQMQQEYALMFNTALHLQVSFLDQAAAHALLTEPVADCYTFDDKAIEQLLALTSRHPYFTQLLCHALFSRWERERWMQVTPVQVNAVLDEAMDLSIANLQYIWNEANRAEKFVLAALAEMEPGQADAATLNHRLEQENVHLEQAEVARALNGLARNEVLDSPARPCFSVELVRRWLAREKPLAWVREELQSSPPPAPRDERAKRRLKCPRLPLLSAPQDEEQEARQRWWAWVLSGIGLVILLVLVGLNMRGCAVHEFLY